MKQMKQRDRIRAAAYRDTDTGTGTDMTLPEIQECFVQSVVMHTYWRGGWDKRGKNTSAGIRTPDKWIMIPLL
jgi:hypothetical protein